MRLTKNRYRYEIKRFNSRTLGRVRLYSLASSSAARLFQFTHPGKGATWCKSTSWRAYQCFNSRTLGRVRRGMEGFPPREPSFNSRTLGRVRLTLIRCNYAIACFNSRTLGRVRRSTLAIRLGVTDVSIHAPWEGCDCVSRMISLSVCGFNSRTLGRVRQ